MSLWTMLLLALGVSADAFAVAVGKGLGMRRLDRVLAFRIAITFGLFQAGMPVLGWLLGSQLARYVSAFDHWVAFGLLAFVGGRMIVGALRAGSGDEYDEHSGSSVRTVLATRELLVLAVATSIDAMAVGIGFAFLEVDVPLACLLIGITTALLSLGGVWVGHRAGSRWRKPAELLGGVVLIGIGLRILLQHLGIW